MDGVSREILFVAAHRPQLSLSGVPERYWTALSKKLSDQTYDAGESFSLLMIDYEDDERGPRDPLWAIQVVKENGVRVSDPSQIYIVDHAWTFTAPEARTQLRRNPALLRRMANMVGVPVNADPEHAVDSVHREIWRYAQFYSLQSDDSAPGDGSPIWYIMDEFGSGIQHSDSPNFRCVPFVHLPERVCYSLLYPVTDAKEGDIVTRNFIETEDDRRDAMLLPWREFDCEDDDLPQTEPGPEYFSSGRVEETLPDDEGAPPPRDRSRRIRVYSEYARVNENLTRPEFEIVADEGSADVLWYTRHFKPYRELRENSPGKYVNQFPFENVVTVKDLLSAVARRGAPESSTLDDGPAWLPRTFNLNTELTRFVACHRRRDSLGLDNHWICKPFNLARGMDTHISDNLNFIVRLPLTGPKIAQKYIERPVLFARPDVEGRVKFDVRYVVLLKSVRPLKVYAYRNFFLRFANKPFALDDFDEYERHFTVMNYTNNANLFRMLCADFVAEWDRQYEDHPWRSVEGDIIRMIKELFECATSKPPPCGIASNYQSRALYAADIMLSWHADPKGNETVQPKLLEVNWMPDCDRACQYYPDFYNDIFSLFFLDEQPETCLAL